MYHSFVSFIERHLSAKMSILCAVFLHLNFLIASTYFHLYMDPLKAQIIAEYVYTAIMLAV